MKRMILTLALLFASGSALAGEAVTYQAEGGDFEGYYAPARPRATRSA